MSDEGDLVGRTAPMETTSVRDRVNERFLARLQSKDDFPVELSKSITSYISRELPPKPDEILTIIEDGLKETGSQE